MNLDKTFYPRGSAAVPREEAGVVSIALRRQTAHAVIEKEVDDVHRSDFLLAMINLERLTALRSESTIETVIYPRYSLSVSLPSSGRRRMDLQRPTGAWGADAWLHPNQVPAVGPPRKGRRPG